MSELTGGRSTIHSDIGKALSQVNEVTRAKYLLGYYPSETPWDGQYRRITVRVNRTGLRLSYRHGYYARETVQPYDRGEILAYSRISAAAAYENSVEDIPFKASVERLKEPGGQRQIRVDLRVDASKVKFQPVNNLHRGKLQIAIFYAGADGGSLGNDWQTLDMDLKEETYQRVVREGIPYTTMVPLHADRQTLKIVVYDCGGDKVGSRLMQLR